MKTMMFSALALALLLPLAGCGQSSQTDSPPDATNHTAQSTKDASDTSSSVISGAVLKAMQKAKQELASSNIELNKIHVSGAHIHIGAIESSGSDSRPNAAITPQGDLLIAGNKVAATPAQQALLLDYREQIVGIADAGMDIGTQGVDLGLDAARQALWGKFSGKSDKDVESAIKPQTDKLKAAALQLCKRLPDLLSSQQKLAAAMPEFRPYATMEQKDVDDCGKKMTDGHGKKGFVVFSN